MIEKIASSLRALAGSWAEDAERRRKVTPGDPAAAALDFAADELRQHLVELERDLAWLSTGEYAITRGVSEQTVRNWCEQHRLPGAERIRGNWRIPCSARPIAKVQAA